ncbi:hypothetical protein ASPWEDRAFT_42893 [Aspergillus wentii DTO 134E9]|uniref:FMN hydroxy acid dehydrogenase domain-containing protein n=1 Tax=Aspergillus wentii DTO 134E9 TaxID=1073089 RepID=A0A1L9RDB4_ASPWE|nr:uncharacterized protein ASPWEDRAFT_42893 [Aspergillus wentii DTO 134E9]OJJ32857.1 hypothetical protein ASPWEDRAFT_42893 [Aspergillus wentii DTO 134E9]
MIRWLILPRVLRNVSHVNPSTDLFGIKYPLPIGIAPSAMQRLASPEGELGMAKAAVAMGLNLTLSSQSTTSLEDVIDAGNPSFWFQIYLTTDLSKSVPLIKRAECEYLKPMNGTCLTFTAAGYKALVLTVDTPVLGNRLNERKTPLVLPPGLQLANLNKKEKGKPTFNRLLMDARSAREADEILRNAGDTMHSSSLTWESTIRFLRQTTSMKIILKGIMTPADANLAVEHGVDAIIVSNHGGRQLDCVPSTIAVLPAISEAVQKRIPVLLDGGIRKGSDVFKALALGADFVLVGRPVLWGLAYKGQEGVEAVMNILEREFSRTMALAGVMRVEEIQKEYLAINEMSKL